MSKFFRKVFRKTFGSLVFWFIIFIGIVTFILVRLYINIEKCTETDEKCISTILYIITITTESIDKDKWQNLLVSIEGFALAIVLGIYTAIRMERTEKYRIEDNEKQDKLRREDNARQDKLRREDNARQEKLRIEDNARQIEDKLTERCESALQNLYTTEKEDLQLFNIRELYNIYEELKYRVSIDFKNQLEEKILNSIFEYLREVGVRGTDSNGFSKDKVANKIFDLFLTSKIKFPEDYRANLKGANLQGANLQGAQLQKADLQNAQLQDAKLLNAQLQNAVLWEANLQGADLREANLQRAILRNAQLQRANLQNAQLQDAKLLNAQLQDAYLWYANLQDASLQMANLQRATLWEANLKFAYLLEADLTKAIVYKSYDRCSMPKAKEIEHLENIYGKYGWKIDLEIREEEEIHYVLSPRL